MADKIRVPKAKILASDAQFVSYMDEGGTLRKARASNVEVIEEGAAPSQPEESTAGEGETSPPHEAATDPVSDPVSPPSSDTPPAGDSGSAPVSSKSKQPRKKTMATAQASTAAKKKAAPPPKAKVAAKKAAPKPRTEASGIRTIGGKAVNLENYEKVKAPGGGTSYHNGDAVAEKLAGKTLDEVYAFAAKILKEDEKALRAKYKHLNVGMQRMSLGNRCRKVMIPKEARN
jgi:hypothetical protein